MAQTNGETPGPRQLRTDIEPYIPNQGESFEEAKARYDKLIRQSDVDHWNKHGYVIIKDFLTVTEFDKLSTAWQRLMPDWPEFKERQTIFKDFTGNSPRNAGKSAVARYDFPYSEEACNELAVHPYLVALAERLAESDNLALSYGHLIGKWAGRGDYDQSLHSDFGNNTLVVPHPDKKFFHLPIIVYFHDVASDLGPTKVVSQTLTEPRGLLKEHGPFHRDKYPELYEHEVSVEVPAGSAVVYSMRTLHRGSAMITKEGCRVAQFVGFHTANCPWMAPLDHQARMGTPESHKFLCHADPAQRAYMGFPPLGHEYWKNEEVLESVGKRYPLMDMRPYGGKEARTQSSA